jgi:hypothetical protein
MIGDDAHEQVAAEPGRGRGADQCLPTLLEPPCGSMRQSPQLLRKLAAIARVAPDA